MWSLSASAQEVDFSELFSKNQKRIQYSSNYDIKGENELNMMCNFNVAYDMTKSFKLTSTTKTVYDFQTLSTITILGFSWGF